MSGAHKGIIKSWKGGWQNQCADTKSFPIGNAHSPVAGLEALVISHYTPKQYKLLDPVFSTNQVSYHQ